MKPEKQYPDFSVLGKKGGLVREGKHAVLTHVKEIPPYTGQNV